MKFLSMRAENGVLRVALDRPPVNAVHNEMYCEIAALFSSIGRRGDETRVVLLAGAGAHFCGGNDLDEFAAMTPATATELMWRVREAFFAVSECAVPVIGVVHGAALGTGLALAASCDFVVAASDARFGLPELTVGVMGGARHLGRIAPQPLVRRMYFTGEALTAAAMADAGGAVMVCEPERLAEEADRLAARVASFSPTALLVSKRVLDRIEWMDLRAGYEFEQAATERMSGHPDSKEALAAFRDKRAPVYAPLDRDAHWHGL